MFKKIVLIGLISFCFFNCKNKKNTLVEIAQTKVRVSALPKTIKSPNNNPTTKEKVDLGRLLFFDPILSGNKDVACATCHHPKNGYAEFRDISIGVNGQGFGNKREFKQPNDIPFVKRNAHTVLNTAYNGINMSNHYSPEDAPMFWDSRVNSLEDQALEPIKALEEMRGTHFSDTEILNEVVKRLKAIPEYQTLFENVFEEDEPIASENIGKAIAAYERTLVTNNSDFDKYMRGDESAISLAEKEGFELFKKVGCINCHNGPMFSDFKMHVLSVPENKKLDSIDTGFEAQFAFRTPTLRNLRFTAPYMHNGTLASLEKVLEFYEDLSFKKSRNPHIETTQIDTLAQNLTVKVKDMSLIISFLNTLNDDTFDKTVPEHVPSGLQVGGDID
ncbi:cytochrome-c peroxidase [Seonamhaeicola maritimus]|uniref:Cytochrome-c peroxidase n=1 Tax=Seonamhaeicola maritimus TaxID=2591822 RepID=A0A5C7GJD2_9FLAO|nr:cytochrome-c peroxidase [Seonamhaeicola maritimus]TXG38460.1 cytochrome-c peroxidase [Seonamhaeicola maritimus]